MKKTAVMSQMLSLNKTTHLIKPRSKLYHLVIMSACEMYFATKLLNSNKYREISKGTPKWVPTKVLQGSTTSARRGAARSLSSSACPGTAAHVSSSTSERQQTHAALLEVDPGFLTHCWILMRKTWASGWFDSYKTLFRTFAVTYIISYFWRLERSLPSCGLLLLCL